VGCPVGKLVKHSGIKPLLGFKLLLLGHEDFILFRLITSSINGSKGNVSFGLFYKLFRFFYILKLRLLF